MQIPINYLQERFPIFSYSTLQKYKTDKESKSFFKSKKDFYIFLEANYILELKARKKLIKILNFKDIYFLSKLEKIEEYIYKPNPIKSLIQNFKKLQQDNFIYFPELFMEIINDLQKNNLIKSKNINKNKIITKEKIDKHVSQIVKSFKKIYKKQDIIENLEKKILFNKELNYFDNWVILEMIMNAKKYNELTELKTDYKKITQTNLIDFKTDNDILELLVTTPDNKQEIFFLEYNKKSNKILIREKINFNRNKNKTLLANKELRTKKLEEPKWVYFSENHIDLYIDHSFNFIEINYEDAYFQYNLLRFPLDVLLQ